MNKDDVEEMYGRAYSPKKKKYSGLARIVNGVGAAETELMAVGLAKTKLKREYFGLKGFRIEYDFEWV